MGRAEAVGTSRAARAIAAFALTLALAGLAGGEALLDAAHPGACASRESGGSRCLGCGGTRAFGRIAAGDLAGAVALSPLGAWAGLALWLLAAGSAAAAAAGRLGPLAATLFGLLLSFPLAFVWNAMIWWTSLPAGLAPP